MAQAELILPVVNSSSTEHLVRLQQTLQEQVDPFNRQKQLSIDNTIQLRVALNPDIVDDVRDGLLLDGSLPQHTPQWLRGIHTIPGFSKLGFEHLSRTAIRELSGNETSNKGLNLNVTPSRIRRSEVVTGIRYSRWSEGAILDEDDPEYAMLDHEKIGFKRHATVWQIEGTSTMQRRNRPITAMFIAGIGGGVLRILDRTENHK